MSPLLNRRTSAKFGVQNDNWTLWSAWNEDLEALVGNIAFNPGMLIEKANNLLFTLRLLDCGWRYLDTGQYILVHVEDSDIEQKYNRKRQTIRLEANVWNNNSPQGSRRIEILACSSLALMLMAVVKPKDYLLISGGYQSAAGDPPLLSLNYGNNHAIRILRINKVPPSWNGSTLHELIKPKNISGWFKFSYLATWSSLMRYAPRLSRRDSVDDTFTYDQYLCSRPPKTVPIFDNYCAAYLLVRMKCGKSLFERKVYAHKPSRFEGIALKNGLNPPLFEQKKLSHTVKTNHRWKMLAFVFVVLFIGMILWKIGSSVVSTIVFYSNTIKNTWISFACSICQQNAKCKI